MRIDAQEASVIFDFINDNLKGNVAFITHKDIKHMKRISKKNNDRIILAFQRGDFTILVEVVKDEDGKIKPIGVKMVRWPFPSK